MIRDARIDDCELLSDLAFASKAHWGYDEAFMEACRAELTYTAQAIERGDFIVADYGGRVIGFSALVRLSTDEIELDAMFVDPAEIGRGHGGKLMARAVRTAGQRGARRLVIQADPNAEPFYQSVGARRIGTRASASIAGRQLPLLVVDLQDEGRRTT